MNCAEVLEMHYESKCNINALSLLVIDIVIHLAPGKILLNTNAS